MKIKVMTKQNTVVLFIVMILCCVLLATSCQEEHQHSFTEWTIIKDPTCAEEGIQESVCQCGTKETKAIEKKQHSTGEWIIELEPTCTAEGIKYQKCLVCESIVAKETMPIISHKLCDIAFMDATYTRVGNVV